jgi:hypothetical protein
MGENANKQSIFSNLKFQLLAACVIRLFLTWYGLYHDSRIVQKNLDEPKYTDVDYNVFNDAAAYIYKVNPTIQLT